MCPFECMPTVHMHHASDIQCNYPYFTQYCITKIKPTSEQLCNNVMHTKVIIYIHIIREH